MRRFALLAALLASGASAQAPLAPEAGTFRSATGRFALAVPTGWDQAPPTGDMLQGEVLLSHRLDSTYVSPLLLPPETCGALASVECADAVLSEAVFALTGEGDPAVAAGFEVTTPSRFIVDGKRLVWQSVRQIAPAGSAPDGWVHVAVLARGTTHVFVIAASPPNADPDRWRRLVNGIEIAPEG